MLLQQGDEVGVPLPDGHRGGDVAGGPALLHLLGEDLGQVLAGFGGGPLHPGGEVLFQVEGDLVGRQLGGGHLVLLHHFNEFRIGDLLGAGIGDLVGQEVKEDHQYEGPEDGADEKPAPAGAAAPLSLVVLVGTQRYGSLRSGGEAPLSGCMHSRRGTYPAGILSRFGDTPRTWQKYGIIFPPAMQETPCDLGVKKL